MRGDVSRRQRARQLRRASIDAEAVLWHHLRGRQLRGHKFRRQHAIGPFIVDFVCLGRALVIEVDGGQHAESRQADEMRSDRLRGKGYRVLRFWNHEVLRDTEVVLEAILEALEAEVTPSP